MKELRQTRPSAPPLPISHRLPKTVNYFLFSSLAGCHLCNFVFRVCCLLAVFQYFTIANIGWLSSLQFCLLFVLFIGCVLVFHHCKYWLVVIFAILSFVFVLQLQILSICLFVVSCLWIGKISDFRDRIIVIDVTRGKPSGTGKISVNTSFFNFNMIILFLKNIHFWADINSFC